MTIGGSRFEPGSGLRDSSIATTVVWDPETGQARAPTARRAVEALDGRRDLDSPTGAGMCIRAEIRCGETAHKPRGR
jgi:hypothetical protein